LRYKKAMGLTIDTASSSRRLDAGALRAWSAEQTIFISSEMQHLAELRRQLAGALRELGFRVVMFEDLGGRDEDAETAYLAGVDQCDIYLGLVADRYGRMLDSGRSPTHEEYLRARERGRRISVWVAAEDDERQGNARDFVQEIQAFHTTGSFGDGDDLVRRVIERLSEIAADDEAPWIKLGDAVFRADRIRDHGSQLVIEAEVRDHSVLRYLEQLRPDQWGRGDALAITTPDRSGTGQVRSVSTEARSQSVREVVIEADVRWADGFRDPMAMTINGLSHEERVEAELAAALLGTEMPEELTRFGYGEQPDDLLADLAVQPLPEGTFQAIARLSIMEFLLGGGRASSVDAVEIGPLNGGSRNVEVRYTDGRSAPNVAPDERSVVGVRPA